MLIDWQDSYIVSLFNCKDYLNRGKYRNMPKLRACNLIELVMKVFKSEMKRPTSKRIEIDQKQD